MPLYIVFAENHLRQTTFIGDPRGKPFEHKEQAENLAQRLKILTPTVEYTAVPIYGVTTEDGIAKETKINGVS